MSGYAHLPCASCGSRQLPWALNLSAVLKLESLSFWAFKFAVRVPLSGTSVFGFGKDVLTCRFITNDLQQRILG